jgi:hypothetical protein
MGVACTALLLPTIALLVSSLHATSPPLEHKLCLASERALAVIYLIHQRFGLQSVQGQQLFMSLYNVPTSAWDVLKLKLVKKILEKGSNFTMVFSGTSVTAGYDNYLQQSYPAIIERRMKPILQAVDINLHVRNFGQAHVECRLLNHCLSIAAAGEADLVGWENSFDCGNAKDAHEMTARFAGGRNAVVLYMVSGSFPLGNCPPSTVQSPEPQRFLVPWYNLLALPGSDSVRGRAVEP